MSQSVDNRVVEMQFDNSNFEKNVAVSLRTLGELKASLNLEDAARSFTVLDKEANKVNLSSLSEGAEKVSNSFSALQIIATTALATIVARATSAGLDIANSLSFGQMNAGFAKYEQTMKSVQTILNALPYENLEHVTSEMDRLQWYTDETSYSFEGMIDNISKFTAQNIGLEESITAMEGIANMAGLTGATVTDATHAMDGFSKAMANGYMNKQNWQWIQTAHMETVQTKQAFMDAAVACGQLIKVNGQYMTATEDTIVTVENFNTTLSKKWLTQDVMFKVFETMGEYSDAVYAIQNAYEDLTGESKTASEMLDMLGEVSIKDKDLLDAYRSTLDKTVASEMTDQDVLEELIRLQDTLSQKGFKSAQVYRTFNDALDATKDAASSTWMAIYGYVFGNAKESTELWSTIGDAMYDAFVTPIQSVASIFEGWYGLGGFDTTMTIVENVIDSLYGLGEVFSEVFSSIIPEVTSEGLYSFTSGFGEFIKMMTLSEDALTGLGNTLKFVLSPLQLVFKLLQLVGVSCMVLALAAKQLTDQFFSLVAQEGFVQDALEKLVGGADRAEALFDAWGFAVENVRGALLRVKTAILNAWDALRSSAQADVSLSGLAATLVKIRDAVVNGLITILYAISNIDFEKIGQGITVVFKAVAGLVMAIVGFFQSLFTKSKEATEAVEETVEVVDKSFGKAKKFSFFDELLKAFGKLTDGATKVINTLTGFVKSFDWVSLTLIALGTGIVLTIFRIARATEKVASAVKSTANGFSAVTDAVKAYTKALKAQVLPKTLLAAAAAIISFAGALWILSRIPTGKLLVVASVIAVLAAEIAVIIGVFAKMSRKASFMGGSIDFAGIGAAFVALAMSMTLIAAALNQLDKVDNLEGALQALAVITLIMGAFAAIATSVAGKAKSIAAFAGSMVLFDVAISGMVLPLKLLGKIKPEELYTASEVMAAALAFFAAVGLVSNYVKGMAGSVAKFSGSLILLSFAITSIVSLVKLVNLLTTAEIATANQVIQEWMTMFVVFQGVIGMLGKFLNLNTASLTLLAIAGAVLLIAGTVKLISRITDDEMDKALKNLATILIVYGALYAVVKFIDKVLAGSDINNVKTALLSMAGMIALMVVPITVLGLIPPLLISLGTLRLALISTIFAVLSKLIMMVIKDPALNPQALSQVSSAMTKLSLAVALMAAPIYAFGRMPTEVLEQGGAAAIVVMGIFSLIGIIFSEFVKSDNIKNMSKFAVGMIALSGAVAIMAGVVTLMSHIKNLDAAWQVTVMLGLLIGSLTAPLVAAAKIGKEGKTAVAALSLMVVAVGMIGTVMVLLSQVDDPNAVISIAVSISLVLGVLAGAMWGIAGKKIDNTVIEALMLMIGALAIIGIVFTMVKDMDADKALALGGSLSMAMLAFSGAFAILGKVKISKTILPALTMMLEALAIVGLIFIFMKDLENPGAVLATGASISAVLIVLALSMSALDGLKVSKTILPALQMMMAAIGEIGLIFYLLRGVEDPLGILAVAAGMSLVLLALDGALYLGSKMGATAKAAAVNLVIAAGALSIIGATMAIVSASKADIKTVGVLVAGIAIMLGSLAVIAAMSGVLMTGVGVLEALAMVGITAGAALVLVAGSFLIFVASIKALAKASNAFMDVVERMAALGDSARAATDNLLYMLGNLASMIPLYGAKIGSALALMFANFLAGVAANAQAISAGISAFITIIGDAIIASIGKISEVLNTLFLALIGVITTNTAALSMAVTALLRSIIHDLEDLIPDVLDFIGLLLSEILTFIIDQAFTVADAFITLITRAMDFASEALPRIINSAGNFVLTFINSINEGIVVYGEKIREAATKLIETLVKSLLRGQNKDTVRGKAAEVVTTFVKVLTGDATLTDLIEAGKFFVEGLVRGIIENIKAAIDAAKEIVSAVIDTIEGKSGFDINSPSKVAYGEGEYFVLGLRDGIMYKTPLAEASAEQLAEAVLNPQSTLPEKSSENGQLIAEKLSSTISSDENVAKAKAAGWSLGDGLFDGLMSTEGEIATGADALANVVVNTFGNKAGGAINKFLKLTTEETFKSSAASLEQVQAEWLATASHDEIAAYYAQLEKEVKAAEPAVKDLGDEMGYLGDATSKAGKSTGKTEKSVEELLAEFKLGETVVKRFVESIGPAGEQMGTIEQRTNSAKLAIIQLGEQFYNLQKDAIKATDGTAKQLEERLKGIEKAFTSVYDNISKAMSSINIFDELGDPDAFMDSGQLIQNMEDQLDYANLWAESMQEFGSRAIGASGGSPEAYSIIDQFSKMGMSAMKYIRSFLSMSDEEFSHALDLYSSYLTLPQSTSDAMMADWAKAGQNFSQGFSDGLDVDAARIRAELLGTNSLDSLETSLDEHSPSKKTRRMGQYFVEGFDLGVLDRTGDSVTTVSSLGKIILNAFDKEGQFASWTEFGQYIVTGLIDGINSRAEAAISAAERLANAVADAVAGALDIHSPSRVFRRFGEYIDLGLAQGITRHSDEAVNATQRLSTNVREAMAQALAMINGEIDTQPVIRPTLDLSDVQRGWGEASSMFNAGYSYSNGGIQNGGSNGSSISFVQNNYSPKSLSRKEIYRQTKNELAWAKGVVGNI